MNLNKTPKGAKWFTKQRVSNLLTGLVLIVLFFVAGLSAWFKYDFNPQYLFSTEWWGDTLLQIGYNYATLMTILWWRVGFLKENDPEYLLVTSRIKQAIDRAHPSVFNTWYVEFTRKQKIQHYKNYIAKLTVKLEHRAKDKDLHIWEFGTIEEKRKNRYCKKRTQLEYWSTEEYITANINKINVGYKPLHKSFIMNGYNRKGNSELYEVENGLAKALSDLAPRTILITTFILITRTISINLAEVENKLQMVILTALIIIPMIMHAITGFKYSDTFMAEKEMVDARNREEILALFFKETKEKEASANGMAT